ncbi:MAG TPA: sigma-70 family RNA polymerase sigma factor [Gemmatimonadaceae bacterium]|nr:sigma-70 family RNA polymerase sigma factor [Gemmatimonadaceae bacterium]
MEVASPRNAILVGSGRIGTDRIGRRPTTDAGAGDDEGAIAERAWVDGIRRGDPSALEAVVRAYGPGLAQFAFGFVGDRAESEDIVQDVLWRIWDGRDHWRAPTSLRAYLLAAVRNRALNVLGRRRTRDRHALMVQQSGATDPDLAMAPNPADVLADAEATAEVMATLRRAFLGLTERQQTAIRLRYEQGLSFLELAGALGVTLSGAEQLVARAIRALRAEVARPDMPAP